MTEADQREILLEIVNGPQDVRSINNMLKRKVPQHIIGSGRTQANSKGKFKK